MTNNIITAKREASSPQYQRTLALGHFFQKLTFQAALQVALLFTLMSWHMATTTSCKVDGGKKLRKKMAIMNKQI